ncbi:MAG: DUF4276 family protein [Dysgonamonadaceae bacterium]
MSQVILNVLCEGQTEERFAKSVLKDHLKSFKIVVKTTILVTNKKKNIRGGMLSYQQAKTDLELLVKQHSKKTYEKHFYTTMFDLYALPNNFPGYADALKIQDCYDVTKKLEDEFGKDINHHLFIPYIQLHEFEALVFCGLEYLLIDYPDMKKQIEELEKVLVSYDNNPEKINNSPATAPSKRIIKSFESKHHYNKPKSGELVTGKVGISSLKEKCLHFREWIESLEKIAIEEA